MVLKKGARRTSEVFRGQVRLSKIREGAHRHGLQRGHLPRGFVLITLEDEAGLINLVVRPGVYERYRRTLRSALLLLVEGKVQRADGALNVIVERASDLA